MSRYLCIACLSARLRTLMLILLLGIGCEQVQVISKDLESPANLNHLLSLVDSVQVDSQRLVYLHIYADYPTYEPVKAPGEGISCVDDVGRMLEILEIETRRYGHKDLMPLAEGLTDFLFYMQRRDGLWHNFIFSDGAINESHQNSRAEFGWWAARGLRGLAAAYGIFHERNPTLADSVLARFSLCEEHLNTSLSRYPEKVLTAHGLRAGWLINSAPDQSTEFLLALAKMHRESPLDYSREIRILAEGLLTYQYKNPGSAVDGMFFCWDNLWHNWGNLQALALIESFQITQDSTFLAAVEQWAGHFLTWMAEAGHFHEIAVSVDGAFETLAFPQIAYGIGSSYKGIRRLAALTNEPAHSELADRFLQWFDGANRANAIMYDSATGRCYDGINSDGEINFNSGAESTIEALAALLF